MTTIELSGELYERADALKIRLGIADATLWRLSDEGMPQPVKIGRWRFYPRQAVDRWFVQRAQRPDT